MLDDLLIPELRPISDGQQSTYSIIMITQPCYDELHNKKERNGCSLHKEVTLNDICKSAECHGKFFSLRQKSTRLSFGWQS